MNFKSRISENRVMLFILLTFILLLLIYLNFDTTTGEARKLSNLSKHHLRQGELASYFGEITNAKPTGYIINGNRRKRFPGKAMICFDVKGTKAEGEIEFVYHQIDTTWVLEKFVHGPCGSYTY
jgi:hypothetical protein